MGAISFSLNERLVAFLVRELPLEVFVETGTFQGDSLQRARKFFQECFSVELSHELFTAAVAKFRDDPAAHLHQGESPAFLLAHRQVYCARPALFWLDAHWCVADHTAGTDSQSPLIRELQAIGPLHPQSVVLIDDARLYLCPPPAPHRLADWPDFHEVNQALSQLSSGHRLAVYDDVLLFYPGSIRAGLTEFMHKHGADWLHLANLAREFQRRREKRRRWTRFFARSKNRPPPT
jgi:hypothetical protein